jgi:hypothetical protein
MIMITAGYFTSFLSLDRLSSIMPAIAPAISCMLRETRIASHRMFECGHGTNLDGRSAAR